MRNGFLYFSFSLIEARGRHFAQKRIKRREREKEKEREGEKERESRGSYCYVNGG